MTFLRSFSFENSFENLKFTFENLKFTFEIHLNALECLSKLNNVVRGSIELATWTAFKVKQGCY